jgi:dihydrodipicolinate synthase/N-acetylneuraminate lyase
MKLHGVLPIVHTPFTDRDSIDFASLTKQIDWAIEQGVNGFGTGMVSELLRLTGQERMELTAELGKMASQQTPFFAGVGAESTRQAIEYATAAESAGAAAVMATPPFSTALPNNQLLGYFAKLAGAISIPVIVQDASSYVGQAIPHSVCLELLERFGPDRILFKPEAAPLGPNLSALRDATAGTAQIFEGSGGIALVDSYRRGIVGTMPGMEFLPGIVALWRALKAGANDDQLYGLHFPICALVALQMQAGLDGFLAIEKYVLHQRGLFANADRREPYGWSLDDETRLEVHRLLHQLDKAMEL